MSNWWANGCPAEHSKLTAKSTIRFLSSFSSKHASLPGPLPVGANTCVAFESNCGARGEEHLCCCGSAPRAARFHGMLCREAVDGSAEQPRALRRVGKHFWLPDHWGFCNQRLNLLVCLRLCESSATAAENCQIPSVLCLKLVPVKSVGQRHSLLLAILGFLYEF